MKTLALILALAGLPAYAQNNCAPHEDALAALERAYGETVQARALQNNGTMVEITANTETGTWTAVVTDASGMSCGATGGTNYTPIPPGDPA